MKKLICLFFYLLLSLSLSAQIDVDSLKNLLNTTDPTSTERLHIYKEICAVYKDVNSDSLSRYAQEGISLAEKGNNEAMLTTFYRYAGISCFQKEEFDKASDYFDKALKLAVKLKNKDEEAAVYLAMGYMHGLQTNFELKIKYMLKALPMFESLRNKEKMLEIYVGIGSTYRMSGSNEKALEYFNKAEEISKESSNDFLNALLYFEMGGIMPDVKDQIESESKAIEFARSAGNKTLENLANKALAAIYMSDELQDYDKALIYAKESYRIAKEQGSQPYIYSALTVLSTIYQRLENYGECNTVSLEAWAMDSTNWSEGISLTRNIALANIYLGNKETATLFLKKYTELTDKYTSESYHEKLLELTTKYETEKKETRIAVLEKEQKLYIGLGIAALIALLLAIGLIFYRHRLTKQKQETTEQQIKQLQQEKELVAARSALNTEKAEREIIARDLHDGIGTMLSIVKNNMIITKSHSIIDKNVDYFDKALDGLDESITELRRVAHHLMPIILIEKGLPMALDDFCRSTPETEFHFTGTDRRFDSEKELTLYRCTYELVNNALRHSGASHIDVHLNMDEKTVYLSVVDNGCGFDPQAVSMGMGMNNMRSRLSAFGGRIDIYSEEEKGTEVNIELEV